MTSTIDTHVAGPAACLAAGVSYRQIDYWCRSGLLGDQHVEGPGSGLKRRFDASDIDVLRALRQVMALRSTHPPPDWPQRVALHVREHGLTGTVELVPGVTVDFDRLGAGE